MSEKAIRIGNIYGDYSSGFAGNVYDPQGIAPCLTTLQGGRRVPMILDKPILVGGFGEKKSNNGTQWYQQDRVYDADGIAMAHCANIPGGAYKYLTAAIRTRRYAGKERAIEMGGEVSNALTTVQKDSCVVENLENIRIRMLTPKECWRLMAFDDESFGRAEKVNSKTQLYKQAGNSICVNVLEAIFGEMFEGHEEDYKEHWG